MGNVRSCVLACWLLVGCGGDDDGGVVTVETDGNATVVVHDNAGAPLTTVTADGSGIATCNVPAGGMITVITPLNNYGWLTVMGVSAGDVIRLRAPTPPPSPTSVGMLAVDYTPYSGSTNTSVGAGIGCDSTTSSPPQMVTITSRCTGADGAPSVLAMATDATGLRAFASVSDIALTANPTPVTLPAWRTDLAAIDTQLTNITEDIGEIVTRYEMIEDAAPFRCPISNLCEPRADNAGATFAMTFSAPVFGDGVRLGLYLRNQGGREAGEDVSIRNYAAMPSTIDVATELLPHVTAQSIGGTLERPSVTWTTTSSPSGADAALFVANFEGNEWAMIAPASTPSPVTFPQLPGDLAPSMPRSTASPSAVLFMDFSWIDDYAALRADPFAAIYAGIFGFATIPEMSQPGGAYRYASTGDTNLF